MHDSFSVVLRGEEGIFVLNGLHLVVELVVVPDNGDASVDAGLDFDGAETEQGHGRTGVAVVLGTSEGLSGVLNDVDIALLQEGHDWGDIEGHTEEVGKEHCLGLEIMN